MEWEECHKYCDVIKESVRFASQANIPITPDFWKVCQNTTVDFPPNTVFDEAIKPALIKLHEYLDVEIVSSNCHPKFKGRRTSDVEYELTGVKIKDTQIRIPRKAQFFTSTFYYTTMLHELLHALSYRLEDICDSMFESSKMAIELAVDMAELIICERYGLAYTDPHYITTARIVNSMLSRMSYHSLLITKGLVDEFFRIMEAE